VAQWDSADLLLRLKRRLARPATEEAPPPDSTVDATLYALLEEGQVHWTQELASHVPDLAGLYTYEKLTTADSGLTYDFTSEPLGHYEIRESPNGRLLVPGAEWDPAADFIPAGKKIRFPGQTTKQFANGPWARYVKTPGLLNATNEPTLQPPNARILIVDHAAGLYAMRGGERDPQPFWDLETRHAFGDGAQVGIIGALKQAAFLAGSAGVPSGESDWYKFITDGSGYTRTG
jgi:hypothetical protein